MAEVILIHGIAQEQQGAAVLEAEWLPALADGVRAAGRPDLAGRIWPPDRGVDARMAFYGDLFRGPDFQGTDDDLDDLPPDQYALAAAIAEEWLNRAAHRDGHPDQQAAATELAYLDPRHEDQGAGHDMARAILRGLGQLRWFAEPTMAFAQRFVNKSLRQVTAYLTDPHIRHQVDDRVLEHLGPETRVIIGHSLGSVVAYQVTAEHLDRPLPLLLTLGSPLGLGTVIYHRLRPQPPVYPQQVARWVNLADRDDLTAAEPDLTALFTRGKPDTATLESIPTINNGAKPHNATFYLTTREAGAPLGDCNDFGVSGIFFSTARRPGIGRRR